ncbi:MAG TPA: DICT sensory domain-containing protein [Pyrinomonadaceae bacterium]|nr:DICT sensory domain-containing protein [Pyrinomonadaceae bacterium]
MKEFSMFDQALNAAGECIEDLGTVAVVSRRDFDERQTFRFRTRVPCLEYLSLLIENALLLRTHRGGRVYVGFERLSNMEPIVDRYMRIADISERVYVFGEPDWKPPRHPNLRVIHLREDLRLAREWFVVADSPSLQAALVGFDEEGFTRPVLEERTFNALKTHDPALVSRLAAAAESLIDDSLKN